jgi:galactokinase
MNGRATAPRPVLAFAAGRVNLMGDHTDYNEGLVLPALIPQRTFVTLTARSDRQVVMRSGDTEPSVARYELGNERAQHGWIDYVQGVTAALAARGYVLGGCEGSIQSSVPIGAGLASSAALEVALLRALREAFALELDDVTLAHVGRAAEVDFVGAPVGIMDQLVVSLAAGESTALFIDTRSLRTRPIALPPDIELVVVDSGISHAHGQGQYRNRRKECSDAAELLGVASLRDVGEAQKPRLDTLDAVLRRRVLHVMSENERVLATVEALERSDHPLLGHLFARSHASLRDDFEASIPEIDRLVALGAAANGIVAARMTGGGFGGSVVMLARAGQGARAAREIAIEYARTTGRRAQVLLPQQGGPADEDADGPA